MVRNRATHEDAVSQTGALTYATERLLNSLTVESESDIRSNVKRQ